MPRGLTTAQKSAASAAIIYPAIFCQFDFDSGTTYYWSGVDSISWNSETWTGGALIGSVEIPEAGEQLESKEAAFNLSAVDTGFYAALVNTQYRGRGCHIWFNFMSAATGTPTVSQSVKVFEGRMQPPTISTDGEMITMRIPAENRLVDLFRPYPALLTPSHHKRTYPSDTFYDYVATNPGRQLPWGLRAGDYSGPGNGSQGNIPIWNPRGNP